MSRTMNLPQISKILQDFERESSAMDMKEEMMSDTIDDVMDEEGETEEEESDAILKQVLDEIGVSMNQQVRPNRCTLPSHCADQAVAARRDTICTWCAAATGRKAAGCSDGRRWCRRGRPRGGRAASQAGQA